MSDAKMSSLGHSPQMSSEFTCYASSAHLRPQLYSPIQDLDTESFWRIGIHPFTLSGQCKWRSSGGSHLIPIPSK